MGFRFRDDTCSLHYYSVEAPQIGETQTLTEVAEALVSNIDDSLKAYASTIPVNML